MARDPNERRSSTLIEKPGDVPQGVVLPPQVKAAGIGTGNGQYYAYRVVYADGRSEVEWYKRGSGGGPDQPDPVELRTEAPIAASVKAEWDKDQQAQQTAAGKREVRKYPGTDPQTGLPAIVTEYEDGTRSYDSSTRPATAQGAKEWRTEGTPDPNAPGGYDNSRPIMAAYVNGQRTGETRAPTGKELQDWHEAGQRSRNPGGKTDADVQAEKDKADATARQNQPTTIRVPVDGHPGISMVTEKNPQTGVSDTYYVNASGQRIPQPAAAPSYSVTQRTINGQTFTVVTKTPKDGSEPTITNYGSDGQPVATLPTEGQRPLPAGMPQLDTSSADAARNSYLAQVKWTQEQVAAGKLSQKEAVDLLTPSHQAADTVIQAEDKRIADARATRTQDIQQEGNRLQAATTQGNNHRIDLGEIQKFGPVGGTQTGDAWLTNLMLQGAMNAGVRGNVGPAAQTHQPLPGPAAALPGPVQTAVDAATPPNAIGLGGPGVVFTPQGGPAPVSAERAADIMANPLLRPAPVTDPVAPTTAAAAAPLPGPVQSAVNAASAAAPSPAASNPSSNVGQIGDPATQPPAINPITGEPTGLTPLPGQPGFGTAPVNPPMGAPGHDPTKPVGMMPDFDSLPVALRGMYGRSVLDNILRGQGVLV